MTWIPDTFFTALLSGRISSLRDEKGAIFIDRDPKIFSIILNYLRTREIDLKDTDLRTLRHEAEYYGIAPLVKRLMLCEEMTQSSCGDVLFYGYLPPPCIPLQDASVAGSGTGQNVEPTGVHTIRPGSIVRVPDSVSSSAAASNTSTSSTSSSNGNGAVSASNGASAGPSNFNSVISEAGDYMQASTSTSVNSFPSAVNTNLVQSVRPAGLFFLTILNL